MVVSFEVRIDNGGGAGNPGTGQALPSGNNNQKMRFETADRNTPVSSTDHPIPRPESGTRHSYCKSLYLYCTNAPDNNANNLRFYSDGNSDAGLTINISSNPVGRTGNAASPGTVNYVVATGTEGTDGTPMQTLYAGSMPMSVTNYTVADPLTITISELNEGVNDIRVAGDTSDYFIMQAAVTSTADAGTSSEFQYTIQYDET